MRGRPRVEEMEVSADLAAKMADEADIALLNSQKTLAIINKYGIRNFWVFSSGGHQWANWRRYLYQTAQIMFPD